MDKRALNEIAEAFLQDVVQEWGQTEDKRLTTAQAVLDLLGLRAKVTRLKATFGRLWSIDVEGNDAVEARALLHSITVDLHRGEYWNEVDQIRRALAGHHLTKAEDLIF